MAEEASKATPKSNKKTIIICIAAAVVVVAIVVTAILLSRNKLGDNYFVSDGSKYVLTLDDENFYGSSRTHTVVFYKGDQITEMKKYLEFESADKAKTVFDELAADEETKGGELNGKYIIFTADPEEYSDMTASSFKQLIDFYTMLKGLSTDDSSSDDEEEDDDEVYDITVEDEDDAE